MEKIKKFFEGDLFAKHCGIEILEVKPGWSRCRLEIQERHLNGVRVVQGGAIFTLADLAFALACNAHGTVAVAINVSITFMKGVSQGVLIAEAVEEAKTPKLSTCKVNVTNEAGDLIATFQGLAYRKNAPLPGLA